MQYWMRVLALKEFIYSLYLVWSEAFLEQLTPVVFLYLFFTKVLSQIDVD